MPTVADKFGDTPGYEYDRDTPPAKPTGGPPPDKGPEVLQAYDTTQLRRWRNTLRSPIPSDPSVIAALCGAVGMMLDREIAHPNRVKRDKTVADASAKHTRELDEKTINERADAEIAALPVEKDGKPNPARVEHINHHRKWALANLDYKKKRAEMHERQQKELADLHAKQADELGRLSPDNQSSPAPSGVPLEPAAGQPVPHVEAPVQVDPPKPVQPPPLGRAPSPLPPAAPLPPRGDYSGD